MTSGLILMASLVILPVGGAAAAQGPSPSDPPAQAAPSPAPGDNAPRIQVGLGLMMGIPVGEFQDNVTFSGGISGHIGFGLGRSPVTIGAEATYLWYGTERRDVPLVGLPNLSVEVETSNDILLLHGRVRAQKPAGRVRPYVDGLVGFNYLITTTSVQGDESRCYSVGFSYSCSDDDGDSITNLDDLVLSVGGGGGVMIAFSDKPNAARLDLSLRYLSGGEARYLTEGDIRWESDPTVFVPRFSRTDMLLVQIGVVFGR